MNFSKEMHRFTFAVYSNIFREVIPGIALPLVTHQARSADVVAFTNDNETTEVRPDPDPNLTRADNPPFQRQVHSL
jgi:hypothetical protein